MKEKKKKKLKKMSVLCLICGKLIMIILNFLIYNQDEVFLISMEKKVE